MFLSEDLNLLLIAAGDDDAGLRGFAADHIDTRSLLDAEGYATDGGLRLFLDLCLGLGCAVPVAEEESAVLYLLLELLIVVALKDVGIAIVLSLFEDVGLDVVEQLLYVFGDSLDRTGLLLQCITTHDLDGAVLQVAGTQYQTPFNS